jgi:hypothetical protein
LADKVSRPSTNANREHKTGAGKTQIEFFTQVKDS